MTRACGNGGKCTAMATLILRIWPGVDCVCKLQVLYLSAPSQKRGWSSATRDNDWRPILWISSFCWDGITKTMVGENHQRDPGVFHRWKEKGLKKKPNGGRIGLCNDRWHSDNYYFAYALWSSLVGGLGTSRCLSTSLVETDHVQYGRKYIVA